MISAYGREPNLSFYRKKSDYRGVSTRDYHTYSLSSFSAMFPMPFFIAFRYKLDIG